MLNRASKFSPKRGVFMQQVFLSDELYFNARQLLAGAVEFSRFYLFGRHFGFFSCMFFLLDEHFLLAACLAVAASLAPVGASC